MGLIQAVGGAGAGVLADTWRDYFYSDALDADTLVAIAKNRTSNRGRSSNTKRDENIISNGSIIAVADGQCMIIVEQGEIVEVCAVPGEFVWDASTEPSLFFGPLGKSIGRSFERFGRRIGFGGDTGNDQRVYYFNTKEIVGNKYGTPTPVPFRVVDANIGLDLDSAVRMNGIYSYKLTDPILFYKNVCGNVEDVYTRNQIDSQMKSEILTALQPALARISGLGVRYSAVPGHTAELANFLNDEMSEDWRDLRGIEIVSFGVNSLSLSPEDEDRIKNLQTAATMRDPNMAAASIAAAQSDAMRSAAENESGAVNAFMGMGMAGAVGGMNASGLFSQSLSVQGASGTPQSQYAQAAEGGFAQETQDKAQIVPTESPASIWKCACGSENTGKFCGECGRPRPQEDEWSCASCGTQNSGKFCKECGTPRQNN